jgi:hypothetical protein
MPFFDSAYEMIFPFVIDYSMSPDGRDVVIYEVQQMYSNNYAFDEPSLSPKETQAASQRWQAYFRQKMQGKISLMFPNGLSGNKYRQRALLCTDPATAAYNPELLLADKNTPLDEILDFIKKHEQKVVIKCAGLIGAGNVFTRGLSESECRELLADYLNEEKMFTVEKEVMYPAPEEDSPEGVNTGVYYRDVVFYSLTSNDMLYYRVYTDILDMAVSTNSHDEDGGIQLYAHLVEHTPESLKAKMDETTCQQPNFAVYKEAFFKQVSMAVLRYLASNLELIWDDCVPLAVQATLAGFPHTGMALPVGKLPSLSPEAEEAIVQQYKSKVAESLSAYQQIDLYVSQEEKSSDAERLAIKGFFKNTKAYQRAQ